MQDTATRTAPPPATTTAEDTLRQKTRDPNVISGGHLVAKALRNEGVDTIFTLCGGHIIDIYDGCVDEGIRIIHVRHEQVAAHACVAPCPPIREPRACVAAPTDPYLGCV